MKFYIDRYNENHYGVTVDRSAPDGWGEEFIGHASSIEAVLAIICDFRKKPNSPPQRIVIETEAWQ